MKISNMIKVCVLAIIACFVFGNSASALEFNRSRIIDDAIFDNSNSMSASAINSFLNQFPNSCISPNKGFQAREPIGYSPSDGFKYGNNVSAGQVIYAAAQAYGLNPQVLLTTLQKEQSLITGGAGCSTQRISKAVGYGCPDGGASYNYSGVNLYTLNGTTYTSVDGTCVNSAVKVGFSQQIIRAAWFLKFAEQRSKGNIGWAVIKDQWDNSDDPQSCYSGPMTEGNYQRCPSGPTVYYDGYRTIDNTSIHLDTGATAALYWYTPHFSGNQSFFNIFTGWFGTTVTSGFTWDPVSQQAFTDDTKTTTLDTSNLLPGMRGYMVVRVKNVGTQTWQKGKVNLATSSPGDRDSYFFDSRWYGRTRPATLKEDTVAPGQIGTFEFWITVTKTGIYKEYFSLVAEGITWMNDWGLYYYYKVNKPTYLWEPVEQKVYTDQNKTTAERLDDSSIPGSKHYAVFRVKNVGNMTWYKGQVRVGTTGDRTSAIRDASWISGQRAATLKEDTVAPGQIGTFEFWINTPTQWGRYKEYFNIVVEGVTWMNDLGMHFLIFSNRPYTWQPYQQTAYTDATKATPQDLTDVTRGRSYYLSLKVKNVGSQTWYKDQVRLGTSQPGDRNSIFHDNRWLSNTRPATLQEDSVAPGQTGTFEFWVTVPNTTLGSSYKEYFNFLREGVTWMEDLGLHYFFTVKY